MKGSNYRGESPGKKQARVLFWAMVEDRVGKETFRRGPYLVIASKEAGDVATLLAMGVDPTQIHAVDIDPHAIAAASRKFKDSGVKFYVTDFARANAFCGVRTFLCAFIDMCAPIRKNHLNDVQSVSAKMKGYEFLLGREKDLVSKFIQSVTKTKGQHIVEPRLQYLNSRGFATRSCLYYSSNTETTIGMTMCLAISLTLKPSLSKTEIIEVSFGYKDLRRKIVHSKGNQVPMLYNVHRGVAAAWRAWETRSK